jgi:hypothetical protein
MIPGRVARAGARRASCSTELRMKNARSRVTSPLSLYSIASESPVQYGLPSFQRPRALSSPVPRSGLSSTSGRAGCQAVHAPLSERVRNQTLPGPRQ